MQITAHKVNKQTPTTFTVELASNETEALLLGVAYSVFDGDTLSLDVLTMLIMANATEAQIREAMDPLLAAHKDTEAVRFCIDFIAQIQGAKHTLLKGQVNNPANN